jgi:hypothetical protein
MTNATARHAVLAELVEALTTDGAYDDAPVPGERGRSITVLRRTKTTK